jgi:hypothetical protein
MKSIACQVLSIGIFFTLMIAGLASNLPVAMAAWLQTHGVDATEAQRIAHLPPVSILFAAFLGYNPTKTLLGPKVLASLSASNATTLTGRSFFPHLIFAPFRTGLREAFALAVAAVASWGLEHSTTAAGASMPAPRKTYRISGGRTTSDATDRRLGVVPNRGRSTEPPSQITRPRTFCRGGPDRRWRGV